MTELIQLKKITGVLVDKANSSRPNHYSPDLKIPNQKFGLAKRYFVLLEKLFP